MGIFANEKGTGIKTRSFFKRFISMSKIQLTMDNKKYDLLLFKIEGISYSPKFTHIFFGDDVFFGVSFNFMQVMTYDMGTSPGHRRGGLIFCILRGLSSPHRKNLLRGSFSIGTFRDILTSIHKHISRYLYHSIRKEGIIRKA